MDDLKIIFLDIDGVLNCEIDNPDTRNMRHDISKRCMELLNDLIESTKSKIVISSTWRYSKSTEELQKIFEDHGFKGKIIDRTPRLGADCLRGNEILKWMKDNDSLIGYHSYYNKYVILDDDSDMLFWQKDNYINVDGYVGLTRKICYKAAYILNGKYLR